MGFNRYIVECKFFTPGEKARGHERFNRYIVECKFSYNIRLYLRFIDLIDTQWNVNLDDYGWGTTVEMDLIDTQWNVNMTDG